VYSYCCAACQHRRFNSKAHLVSHLKQHILLNESVVCPYENCSSEFNLHSSLRSHIARKHKRGTHNVIKSAYIAGECPVVVDPDVHETEVRKLTLK